MNSNRIDISNLNNQQPLVSFCLMTYNQEEFIEEALSAAFSQEYPNLEIIISDDCSKDRTQEKIKEIVSSYSGEYKIIVDNNSSNEGLASNFNKIASLANGEFIIIAAGDDISLPDRTEKSVKYMLNNPNCLIADFHVDFIDSKGVVTKCKNKLSDLQFNKNDLFNGEVRGVRGCSRIYRKMMFSVFDPLNQNCPTEDSPCVWRALILGNVAVLKEKNCFVSKTSS